MEGNANVPEMVDSLKPVHDFGWALHRLKAGAHVARQGWNGKGMSLFIWKPDPCNWPDGSNTPVNPYISMFTADAHIQPGWLASQTDMLAEDWKEV